MREKLIQLIKQAHMDYWLSDDCTDGIYEFIADRLIENGTILPPVKVGQTVWFAMCNGVIDDYVNQFLMDIGTYPYSFDEIGKYVFLTREAAEAALKAREKQ